MSIKPSKMWHQVVIQYEWMKEVQPAIVRTGQRYPRRAMQCYLVKHTVKIETDYNGNETLESLNDCIQWVAENKEIGCKYGIVRMYLM